MSLLYLSNPASYAFLAKSLSLISLTTTPMALSPDTLQAVPKESWVMYKATMMAQMGPLGSPPETEECLREP